MADISKDDLRKEIAAIIKDADMSSMSSKKVRQIIEEKLDCDLTDRKKEFDTLLMECLPEKDDDSEEEEEEEVEVEKKKPGKRGRPKKSAPAPKSKKAPKDDDDEEEASEDEDDDAGSDEDTSPKKAKPAKKEKPAKRGRKSKGADESDEDSDWEKKKKTAGSAKKKGGGRGSGSGLMRPITLSEELAAVVGAKQMARSEVIKKIWSIIKERNLYDPKNKQFAICDDELLTVIGEKRFRTFGMMAHLKSHFLD